MCCKPRDLRSPGCIAHWQHFCFSTRVRFLAFPKIYCDVAEIYQQSWSGKSGHRLENVDRTHLILASGNLVLQKKLCWTLLMPCFTSLARFSICYVCFISTHVTPWCYLNRLGLFFFLFACGKFSSSLFEKNLKMTKTVVLVTSTKSHKGRWPLGSNLKK